MSQQPVTNADLMRRLVDIEQGLTARLDDHERRVTAVEADRELVHRLHTRVGDLAEKVTVVHEMLQKNEEHVIASIRQAVRSIADDVLAGVRSEMASVRGDVQKLREAVEARPCAAGGCGVEGEDA